MCPYDTLSDMSKGLIQMVIGLTTILYIVAILPYWIPFLASLALMAHGFVHAGFYASLEKMINKEKHKPRT